MKKTRFLIILVLVGILALGVIAPAFAQQVLGTATINTGRLNVRSGPGVGFSILTTVGQGELVSLIGRNSAASWAQIITFTGVIGWVNAAYIIPSVTIASLPITDGTAATATVINAFHLNVRSGPGVGFGVLAVIDQGAAVTMIGRNSAATWAQIRLSNGIVGWVNAFYLSSATSLSILPITDGTVVQPTTPPATGGPRIHIVQAGETMFSIARLYGVNIYAIAQANNILNLNLIYAGQSLIIP